MGQRWKFVSCVGSDYSGAASGGDDEQQEDALQATIDKSKKVLDMQRNLLHQVGRSLTLIDLRFNLHCEKSCSFFSHIPEL